MPLSIDKISRLNLEITTHCNIRCPQCSRTHPMGNLADFIELKHWDLDKILPNLEIGKMINLKHVVIEGDNGDAFMHQKLLRLLDFLVAEQSQPNIKMLTNGGMRKPQWWKDLGKRYAGRLQVQFSIDGLTDTNSLYRVDIDHQRVLDNVRAFIEGGGDGVQRCIFFKHNQHQIEEIVKQAKEIGMHSLVFMPNDQTRFQQLEKWAVYDRDFNITHYIENTTLKDLHLYGYKGSKIKFPMAKTMAEDEICPEWKNGSLAITYKGHIIPCCMYHADLYFDHPSNGRFRDIVGDIDSNDLTRHKLSWILDTDRFYGKKLTETLTNGKSLTRCQVRCPDLVGHKSFIPIKEIR